MLTDLRSLLVDDRFDRETRLTRLQGWRGTEVDQAVSAGWAKSLAPAICAIGAIAGALLASPVLLGFMGATAVMGAIAANHPFEWAYNAVAPRFGRATLPANRAAKRLGCFLGSLHLGGAAVAFAAGAPTVGLALALPLGVLAGFVAVTGICVPSMLFTAFFGAERGACPSLVQAWT